MDDAHGQDSGGGGQGGFPKEFCLGRLAEAGLLKNKTLGFLTVRSRAVKNPKSKNREENILNKPFISRRRQNSFGFQSAHICALRH